MSIPMYVCFFVGTTKVFVNFQGFSFRNIFSSRINSNGSHVWGQHCQSRSLLSRPTWMGSSSQWWGHPGQVHEATAMDWSYPGRLAWRRPWVFNYNIEPNYDDNFLLLLLFLSFQLLLDCFKMAKSTQGVGASLSILLSTAALERALGDVSMCSYLWTSNPRGKWEEMRRRLAWFIWWFILIWQSYFLTDNPYTVKPS